MYGRATDLNENAEMLRINAEMLRILAKMGSDDEIRDHLRDQKGRIKLLEFLVNSNRAGLMDEVSSFIISFKPARMINYLRKDYQDNETDRLPQVISFIQEGTEQVSYFIDSMELQSETSTVLNRCSSLTTVIRNIKNKGCLSYLLKEMMRVPDDNPNFQYIFNEIDPYTLNSIIKLLNDDVNNLFLFAQIFLKFRDKEAYNSPRPVAMGDNQISAYIEALPDNPNMRLLSIVSWQPTSNHFQLNIIDSCIEISEAWAKKSGNIKDLQQWIAIQPVVQQVNTALQLMAAGSKILAIKSSTDGDSLSLQPYKAPFSSPEDQLCLLLAPLVDEGLVTQDIIVAFARSLDDYQVKFQHLSSLLPKQQESNTTSEEVTAPNQLISIDQADRKKMQELLGTYASRISAVTKRALDANLSTNGFITSSTEGAFFTLDLKENQTRYVFTAVFLSELTKNSSTVDESTYARIFGATVNILKAQNFDEEEVRQLINSSKSIPKTITAPFSTPETKTGDHDTGAVTVYNSRPGNPAGSRGNSGAMTLYRSGPDNRSGNQGNSGTMTLQTDEGRKAFYQNK